ncbi:MAG: TorF family putative porin [bacterium]
MRTILKLASVGAIALLCCARSVIAQQAEEPGGEAEKMGTAAEVKAEDKKAAAADESWLPGGLSGNVAIVTDYSFRGVSQTGRDMAMQGGIDWNHDSGVFAGYWASSTNFGNTYMENDFYGGYAGAIDKWSYKLSTTFFYYPKDQQFNYWEFGAFTGYDFDFLSLSTGLIGSPDYFGTLGTGFYVPMGVNVPIGAVTCPIPGMEDKKCFDLSFDANAGYTHSQLDIFANTHHYWDWNAGLVFALPFNFKLDFRYVGTSEADQVFDAGNRFVFAAKYAF